MSVDRTSGMSASVMVAGRPSLVNAASGLEFVEGGGGAADILMAETAGEACERLICVGKFSGKMFNSMQWRHERSGHLIP